MARSGNSFLRRIIEQITGVFSGSDMNWDITIQMLYAGLLGEETVSTDNLCWVTKTHWPMESPLGAKKFPAEKCFSIVRNPIDLLPSFALLFITMSHSMTITPPVNEHDPAFWDTFIKKISTFINDQTLAMRRQMENEIPTYYIRYEDLVLNPQPVLTELFKFMLDVPSLEGTIVEKRIADQCAKGNSGGSVYKLKADPRKNLSRNRGMYTDE